MRDCAPSAPLGASARPLNFTVRHPRSVLPGVATSTDYSFACSVICGFVDAVASAVARCGLNSMLLFMAKVEAQLEWSYCVSKTQHRPQRLICLTACVLAARSFAGPPAPPPAYVQAIGDVLGYMDGAAIYADLCQQQFPDLAERIGKAYVQWRATYAAIYDEVTRRRLGGYRIESQGNQAYYDKMVRDYDDNVARGRETIRKEMAGDPAGARSACRGVPSMLEKPELGPEKTLAKQLAVIRSVPEARQ